MKRVHCLGGAAGLAPAAFGMIIPAMAHAATTTGTGAPIKHSKTGTSHDKTISGHLWETKHGAETCIGTVDFSMTGVDVHPLDLCGGKQLQYCSLTRRA